MRKFAALAFTLILSVGIAGAQNSAGNNDSDKGGGGQTTVAEKHKVTLEERIKRQYARIDRAVGEGKISADKAGALKNNLAGIENNIASMKQASGGSLNEEQRINIMNLLKQNFNQIVTAAGAGTEQEQGAGTLGPEWQPGKDGAQNPKALLQQMKAQEKRALRQQRQQAMQTLEQQQLQYEKEMINNLGKQKPAIEESKSELQQVRQQAGAN